MTGGRIPVFDLDGTLLDSDRALIEPFLSLGISEDAVTFGQTLAEACSELGVSVDDYLERYDTTIAMPFPGIDELLGRLSRWAIFSNKLAVGAEPEIARLGWKPEVARYLESFGGPKRLAPVLEALGVGPQQAICIGDSEHDRACAREAGVDFALAGWNPRARAADGDIVLSEPAEVLDLLR